MSEENQRVTLARWEPDDEKFWESEGKQIASKNLWISIPNLLLGFSVWIYWGMVAKYIQKIHFGTGGELFDFTFMNRRAGLRRCRLSGVALHLARRGRPVRCDPPHPQLVHDRDLRRSKRQVHDDVFCSSFPR